MTAPLGAPPAEHPRLATPPGPQVEPTLQVVGHPHIFALGDVTNIDEDKVAFLAKQHAGVAAANIAALAAATAAAKPPPLRAWRPGMGAPRVQLVSLGRRAAVVVIGRVVFGGWLGGKLKSIDMLVSLARREVCRAP